MNAHGSALWATSIDGHGEVVKTLLDAGADVNAQCGFYSAARLAASEQGHDNVVKILLDAGAIPLQEEELLGDG